MLKAIIALGGRSVSEEHLVESLWPDAEGDVGHQSFATTLHRLRKIVENDQVLIFSEGKVSLNPLCCWVDVWAFERLANELLDERKGHKDPDSVLRSVEKVLALYTGHFLSSDDGHLWAISIRERLRNKLLRAIGTAGRLLEKQGRLEQAVALYQRGLECDNMVEDFYQRLMSCHFRLCRRGEMISTFNSCCAVMKTIGADPSSKTAEIFEQLFSQK
jgi:DNA-binding SARP family transcriptional activator